MTAALYAQRNGKSALVIEKNGFGGQITHSPKVENYPGTLQMSGNEFAEKMLDQILAQGAEIEFENVISVEDRGDVKIVRTEEGGVYEGSAVVLATGVKHRELGLTGTYQRYDVWQHAVVGAAGETVTADLAPTASAADSAKLATMVQ